MERKAREGETSYQSVDCLLSPETSKDPKERAHLVLREGGEGREMYHPLLVLQNARCYLLSKLVLALDQCW